MSERRPAWNDPTEFVIDLANKFRERFEFIEDKAIEEYKVLFYTQQGNEYNILIKVNEQEYALGVSYTEGEEPQFISTSPIFYS